MQKQFRNLINPQENQPHSAFEKRIPRGQPGGWCPFDMGTTQGQRTPDSVGEVAACPRDMCCMSTASGGSTSRPTAAPSASGRLKSPLWCGHRAESWSVSECLLRPPWLIQRNATSITNVRYFWVQVPTCQIVRLILFYS